MRSVIDCGEYGAFVTDEPARHGGGGSGPSLTTGWAGRREGHYPGIFAPADVVGADLVEVAGRLLALPT